MSPAELQHKWWPTQAARPGKVFVLDGKPNAATLDRSARKWAKAHGYRVETRVFYDVLLLRWSRPTHQEAAQDG